MLRPKQIFIILLFVIFFIIILAVFQNTKNYENSKLKIFFSMITVVTFVLFGIGLIMTSYAIEEGHNLNRTNQTYSLIDRAFINPVKSMNQLFKDCPNFISSLWPQKNIFQNVPKSVVDNESSILELSIVLLQAMEDHFTGSKYDMTGESIWAANFLQWTSSSKFYEMFLSLYANFKQETIDYAKVLFEYSQKNSLKTGDELRNVSKLFAEDQRIKDIFKKL